MASTFGLLQTPIFTENNYEYWSLTMKDLFRGQDAWVIIQHGYTEPANMTAYNNLTQAKKDVLREQRKKRWKNFVLHTSSYA